MFISVILRTMMYPGAYIIDNFFYDLNSIYFGENNEFSNCSAVSLEKHVMSFNNSTKTILLTPDLEYFDIEEYDSFYLRTSLVHLDYECVCEITKLHSLHIIIICTRKLFRSMIFVIAIALLVLTVLNFTFALFLLLMKIYNNNNNNNNNNNYNLQVQVQEITKNEWDVNMMYDYSENFENLYHEPLIDEFAENHLHRIQIQYGDGRDCVICLEYPRHVTLLPCKHLCVCRKCLSATNNQCPICRQEIESTLVAFVP